MPKDIGRTRSSYEDGDPGGCLALIKPQRDEAKITLTFNQKQIDFRPDFFASSILPLTSPRFFTSSCAASMIMSPGRNPSASPPWAVLGDIDNDNTLRIVS